jgi:hypothetical protein
VWGGTAKQRAQRRAAQAAAEAERAAHVADSVQFADRLRATAPAAFGETDSGFLRRVAALSPAGPDSERIVAAQREKARRDSVQAVQDRGEYANLVESRFLQKGLDFHVSTLGADRRTLRVEYRLMDRPTVYDFEHNEDLMGGLRDIGFRWVVLTDGYDGTWTLSLVDN